MGKSVGLVFFQSPKSGLTSLTGLHPSLGHMVTLGGKNGPFPYVGSDMPFPAGIRITRIIQRYSICPINIASHFCGLIRPFRAPGRFTWMAMSHFVSPGAREAPPPPVVSRAARAHRHRKTADTFQQLRKPLYILFSKKSFTLVDLFMLGCTQISLFT